MNSNKQTLNKRDERERDGRELRQVSYKTECVVARWVPQEKAGLQKLERDEGVIISRIHVVFNDTYTQLLRYLLNVLYVSDVSGDV